MTTNEPHNKSYVRNNADEFDSSYQSAFSDRSAYTSGSGHAAVEQTSASPDSYARVDARAERAKQRARKRRRGKRIRAILITLLVLVLVGVGGALAYLGIINGNLGGNIGDDTRNALVKTDLTNEPFYMLLMGTDESAERDSDENFGGVFRADSLILARIDPVSKKVTLVSVPRDTQVNLGDEYGIQKINAASAIGGSALCISTVSDVAGVGISHFALVNFDGFREVVNSLGGIEVDVPMTIDDDDAGGYLEAGPQTLDGDQALILCRARHAYDEYGDGDAYRAANQRLVLSAIANKILKSDIVTIASTVNVLSQYVSTDLSVNDIIGLAQAFQGFDSASSMYSASLPTTSVYEDDLWYEVINAAEWKTMMSRVDQGLPPTAEDIVDGTGTILATTGSGSAQQQTAGNNIVTPGASHTGTVVVRNGSGEAGVGQHAADTLAAIGYTVEDIGNADSFDYTQTIVLYNDASKANEAKEIALKLGIGYAQLNDGTYNVEGDFLVVIGADYDLPASAYAQSYGGSGEDE